MSRTLDQVFSIKPGHISMYSCGPTVYGYYHIGNLRNAVFNDTLRRTLQIDGYKVTQVMNITDVGHLVSDLDEGEDKLEKGAIEEGKSVQQVADFYTKAFKTDMKSLNILEPNGYSSEKYGDSYARATEFIDEQIAIVKILLEKGFAYITDQAIYFEIAKVPEYDSFSGQSLLDKETGARNNVVTDSNKRNSHDFALWFFAVERFASHSMKWESPWGTGFPGWHLECSAIIHATLGDPIDIHTGGIDHLGTHHPNEMVQTQAAYDNNLANMWVHNEFVLVDGKKMSKSKKNTYTLKDLSDKGFTSIDYRLEILQSHYRKEMSFSWVSLVAARNRLCSLKNYADLCHQVDKYNKTLTKDYFLQLQSSITEALTNDLNTPLALKLISDSIKEVEDSCTGNSSSENPYFISFLEFLDSCFALDLSERPDISADQKVLLASRFSAKNEKDWLLSDKLRLELLNSGLEVKDLVNGQLWKRVPVKNS